MNIEFIKSEFEKLTLILRSWKEGHNISTIERDIVLDKLKNIYDAVRFADAGITADTDKADSHPADQAAQQPAAAAAAETETAVPATDTDTPDKEEDEGDEVEVEFIFSDDDEQTTEASARPAADATAATADKTQNTACEAENTADVSNDVVADLPTASASEHQTLAVNSTMPAEVTVSTDTTAQTHDAAAAEPASTADMRTVEPTAKAEPQPEAVNGNNDHEADEASDNAAGNSYSYATSNPHDTESHTSHRPMHSLFGSDEVKQRQPSRHHRMMSIYDDAESKPEKVVDISKIFDNDDYAPDARYADTAYTGRNSLNDRNDNHDDIAAGNTPVRNHTAVGATDEGVKTIADAMSGSKHTLADTLAGHEPLAEQITHSATTSLRDAIGINDKFLLIRDLFAGDEHEYEKAIAKLDSFDNLDDCLIYIAENYAWNPNSEGAKFMMQLLERKLS